MFLPSGILCPGSSPFVGVLFTGGSGKGEDRLPHGLLGSGGRLHCPVLFLPGRHVVAYIVKVNVEGCGCCVACLRGEIVISLLFVPCLQVDLG